MAHVRFWSVAAGLTLAALLSGCASAGSTGTSSAGGGASTPATGYWTHSRLLAAQPAREWSLPPAGTTPSAHNPVLAAPRVGALFTRDASGNHFCTASVVASPGHDLLMTAAHCIHGGEGHGYNTDIVFIPDYVDGAMPYGVWTPRKLLVAPQWASSSDPDFDVGFVVLQPLDGKNIEEVLGANQIGFDAGFEHLVRVTGYPASADAPVTCINRTSQQSARQVKFECGGFFGGTSGSPWLTSFNTQTRTGTIVGVIGGYQEGGDTDAISYSAYLNGDIRQLYEEAAATT
jgi:V8-like Glu-specific endopeptidase